MENQRSSTFNRIISCVAIKTPLSQPPEFLFVKNKERINQMRTNHPKFQT